MSEDIRINLLTGKNDVSKTLDAANAKTKLLNKNIKGTTGGFSALSGAVSKAGAAMVALAAAAAAAGAAFGLAKSIQLAKEQEDAVNALNVALARTGTFSEQASKDMQAFASSLQSVTVFGDEVILKQLALAKGFGATNEQAKLILTAATDLSAAMGIDLNSAVRNVSKTLGGYAGELGEVLPGLKNLTQEQLKSGAALQLIANQFRGAAQGQIKTFGGALQQTKNAFGDLLEEIGNLIIKNPVFVEGIKLLNRAFNFLGKVVKDNREAIIGFVNTILLLPIEAAAGALNFVKLVVDGLRFLRERINAVKIAIFEFVATFVELNIISKPINAAIEAFNTLRFAIIDNLLFFVELAQKSKLVSAAFNKVGVDLKGIDKNLNKTREGIAKTISEFKPISFKDKIDKTVEGLKTVAAAEDKVFGEISQKVANAKSVVDKFGQSVAKVANTPIKLAPRNIAPIAKSLSVQISEFLKTATGKLSLGILGSISSGKKGAQKVLSDVVGLGLEKFAPGLGAAAGPLIEILSQGEDAVRAMVREFAGAIPDLVKTIALAAIPFASELIKQAPFIIEGIVDNLDEIVIGMISQLPELFEAAANLMPKVGAALARSMPSVAAELAKNSPQVAASIAKAFVLGGVPIFGDSLVKQAERFINKLIEGIKEAFTGGGGGKNALSAIAKGDVGGFFKGVSSAVKSVTGKFGFAQGGSPKLVRGGTAGIDSVPALLTPGELVVDRSTNQMLNDFLTSRSFEPKQTIDLSVTNALLGQILALLGRPMTTDNVIEINGEAIASVITELNRTNQRLA